MSEIASASQIDTCVSLKFVVPVAMSASNEPLPKSLGRDSFSDVENAINDHDKRVAAVVREKFTRA